jgi:hypothetical protein
MSNCKNGFTAWEEAQIKEEGCSALCPSQTRNNIFFLWNTILLSPKI